MPLPACVAAVSERASRRDQFDALPVAVSRDLFEKRNVLVTPGCHAIQPEREEDHPVQAVGRGRVDQALDPINVPPVPPVAEREHPSVRQLRRILARRGQRARTQQQRPKAGLPRSVFALHPHGPGGRWSYRPSFSTHAESIPRAPCRKERPCRGSPAGGRPGMRENPSRPGSGLPKRSCSGSSGMSP